MNKKTSNQNKPVKKEVSKKELLVGGFKAGDYAFYPSHGVGKIIEIETTEINDQKLNFLIMNFEKEKLTIKIPAGQITKNGLRALISKSEMEEVFNILRSGVKKLSEVFRYSVDLKVTNQENLINCYNVTYSAITNTNLTYTNCSGNSVTLSLITGNTNTICVKGGTIPSFTNPTGVTYNNGSYCASAYSVYINTNYVGDNLDLIQINDGDTLLIISYKDDITKAAKISTTAYLV